MIGPPDEGIQMSTPNTEKPSHSVMAITSSASPRDQAYSPPQANARSITGRGINEVKSVMMSSLPEQNVCNNVEKLQKHRDSARLRYFDYMRYSRDRLDMACDPTSPPRLHQDRSRASS